MDLGVFIQRVLGAVATAALLGLFSLAWSAYGSLQELTTNVEVIKATSTTQSTFIMDELARVRARLDRIEDRTSG